MLVQLPCAIIGMIRIIVEAFLIVVARALNQMLLLALFALSCVLATQ